MKKFLLMLIFSIGLFSIFNSIVSAQQATPTPAPNKNWVCLSAKRCGDCEDTNGDGIPDAGSCYLYPTDDPKYADCSPNDMNDPLSVEHRAKLTQGDNPVLIGTATYIVDCLATDGGDRCTTGAIDTDKIVYGVDQNGKTNYENMQSDLGYSFDGLYNDPDGVKRPPPAPNFLLATEPFSPYGYEWSDSTPYKSQGNIRKFYALNYTDPSLGSGGTTGEATSQQQGSVIFSLTDAANDQSCLTVQWDPYGRVFDSQTLEPIKGAKVTLLMKRQDGSYTMVTSNDIVGGAIINPFITKEDGTFNFVVPAGDYKITVEHPDYNFPNSSLILNPNYKEIYRQIYPSQTGEIIKENPPVLEYRDIPLDPKNLPAVTEIKLMEYSYTKEKMAGKSIVEGRVSDPFAVIKAYSIKNNAKYRLLTTVQADRMGRFKIEIDETKFDKGETFGQIEYYKIDLTKNLDQKDNTSLTTKISQFLKLDPILNYLEGYAYDQTGKILANATVGVYLKFSNKPYYTTKADGQGYYKISSEHLPFFPYDIRYTASDGTSIKLTTADFISQNDQFIIGQKVDLNTFKNEKGQTFVQKPVLPTGPQANQESPVIQNKTFLIDAAILLVLIIGAATFIGIYLYKKNH